MVKNKENSEDLDFWATNSEEGGWNISSTDEGSQKMNDEESEQQMKIQTGSDVVDDYFIEEETSEDERMIVNMGPQHPSTHGVLRLQVELEGEAVRRVKPIIGYLHTGMEKTGEELTYLQGPTNTTRMDYLSPFFNELVFSLTTEKLLDIEVPARAETIRILMTELNRISSTTQYNGMSVLDGTYTDRTVQVGNLANQVVKFGVSSVDTTTLGAYQINSADEVLAVTATHANAKSAFGALFVDAADYVISGSQGTKTAYVGLGATARDVAAAYNLVSNETNVKATAITRGRLTASADATTYSFTLEGKSSTASTVTATIVDNADMTAMRDAINAVSGSTGITATLTSSKAGINLVQADGYNIIVGDVAGADMTLDAADADGTVTGSAVTLDFDGNDSSAINGTIKLSSDKPFTVTPGNSANHFSAATAALSSSLTQLGDVSLKTVIKATNAIAVIDQSLAMVATSRSKMGALENRLTSTVSNLSNIVTKTEASLSQIMDADFASETTALSKSQILSQASTAMLAQSNKANQTVLQLLQG